MKNIKASTLRTICIVAVMLLIAVGYFTHVGIGNLSGFGWDVFSFLCPLGYLESLLASKTFIPRALISFVLVVVAVLILGRVFCAWICPMPLMQKIIPGFKRKKAKAAQGNQTEDAAEEQPAPAAAASSEEPGEAGDAPKKRGFDSRIGVLIGALGSAAIFGFPVFCLICPVGLTFATVYLVMRLFAFGETTWTVIVIPLILLLEVVFLRKWCGKICPLGALMSLISKGNKTFRPTIDNEKCLNSSQGTACFACSKSCPSDIDIRRPEISEAALSNCTKCRECAEHCPGHAITFPMLPKKDAAAKKAE